MKSTATLHRYALAQAAAELGVHAITLRKALKSRGIEPSGEGFTLAQLVESQGSNGDSSKEKSLEAHASFMGYKATLTALQVREAEGRLIEREAVLEFCAAIVKAISGAIWYSDALAEKDKKRFIGQLCGVAKEFWVRHGWALEPQYSFRVGGERENRDRREIWSSVLCSWLDEAYEARTKEREKETGQETDPEGIDLGGRTKRRRHPEPRRRRAVQAGPERHQATGAT